MAAAKHTAIHGTHDSGKATRIHTAIRQMPAAYTPLFNKCQRHTHRYSTNVSGIHRYSTQVILTVSFGSSAGRVHLLRQRPLKTERRWRRRRFWRRRLFGDGGGSLRVGADLVSNRAHDVVLHVQVLLEPQNGVFLEP